jgi:hypothetical protein
VLTAGFIMGVMLIPFVSSLSDDIINAVPQSLREGSYGLGATQSETIRRVVLPAALPGIVGAVLLAASRAIGETMIVVLAAGIAANLTLNPLEPVTTITVKIVSQLTRSVFYRSAVWRSDRRPSHTSSQPPTIRQICRAAASCAWPPWRSRWRSWVSCGRTGACTRSCAPAMRSRRSS